MRPAFSGITAGLIIYPIAHWGAHWSHGDSALIAALWIGLAYALARAIDNPEPGVPLRRRRRR
jgi:hypothetical protein